MPRISVVVPIYNVEDYLAECLESIATQTFADLEAILVDDGSTDGSAAIAEAYVARDGRFKLLSQPNAGLGAARNTGTDAATGEYLAYVDSDDRLPPRAYERLVGAADRTGSDFAAGNVLRLTGRGTTQTAALLRAFARTRLRTHVTRHRALLADRLAWNKLWRRSFWDAHGYRWPEGVLHEDIPVTIPAHFAARSVDVLADTVYFWRLREGSITSRRFEELRPLRDRFAAVEHVVAHLGEHGPPGARGWYEQHVLRDDLWPYLDALDRVTPTYRAAFLDRAGALLAAAEPGVLEGLPARYRRLWELAGARREEELVGALRARHAAPPALSVRVARRIPERQRRRLRRALAAVRR
jgi:CDP-glycerol glycerophosphotransferase